MDVIAVSGSYRKSGATAAMLDAAAEGAQAAGAEVGVLHLRDLDFAFCTNCHACWEAPTLEAALEHCPARDAMTPWVQRLAAADGLILSSPVNLGSVTALTKKFMERCAPIVAFQPLPWLVRKLVAPSRCPSTRLGKKPRAVVFITASSTPAWIAPWLMRVPKKQVLAFMEAWPARLVDFIWVGATLAPGWTLPERDLARARAAGAKMVRALTPRGT